MHAYMHICTNIFIQEFEPVGVPASQLSILLVSLKFDFPLCWLNYHFSRLFLASNPNFCLFGLGGWWQYEERMSHDIEEHHKSGTQKFETIVCGQLYTIDLESKVQYRSDTPWVVRKILRERPSLVQKRGVAGLK